MPSKEQVLLGDPLSQIYFEHLKLITKEQIYKCRIKETIPSFESIKNAIHTILKIEKYNMPATSFNEKWDRKIRTYFGL